LENPGGWEKIWRNLEAYREFSDLDEATVLLMMRGTGSAAALS